MAKNVVKKKPAKKNGYVMPEPIPLGEILTDKNKTKWEMGPSIGVGGFGEVYSAKRHGDSSTYDHVIKIESHTNGPLFVELHFYVRNAQQEAINKWKRERKLTHLGMPHYISSGSHVYNQTKYRFVVMQRFGRDLHSIFVENKRFHAAIVFNIAAQVLDVLEYIHSCGYVHADVKAANLLLDYDNASRVYLVDFGMAARYSASSVEPDPKQAHNGTIEYLSRDAHKGVMTRRGDLEVLAFNMIDWLGITLPWQSKLKAVKDVQHLKEKFMEEVVEDALPLDVQIPADLVTFLKYVGSLDVSEEPDYHKCRHMLREAMKRNGGKVTDALDDQSLVKTKPGKVVKRVTKKEEGKIAENEGDVVKRKVIKNEGVVNGKVLKNVAEKVKRKVTKKEEVVEGIRSEIKEKVTDVKRKVAKKTESTETVKRKIVKRKDEEVTGTVRVKSTERHVNEPMDVEEVDENRSNLRNVTLRRRAPINYRESIMPPERGAKKPRKPRN